MSIAKCRRCPFIRVGNDPRGYCHRYPQQVLKDNVDEQWCGEHPHYVIPKVQSELPVEKAVKQSTTNKE